MGALNNENQARYIYLESVHSVGRSERSKLQLDDARISLDHASIRWEGDRWTIRDLGSSNGTVVDGNVVSPGEAKELREGARIAFGATEQIWVLEDAASPRVMAIPLSGGQPRLEENGLLALPSPEKPLVTIMRREDGAWVLENQSEVSDPLLDQALILAGETQYRICIPSPTQRTQPVHGLQGLCVADLIIGFMVSPNLDDVGLLVRKDAVVERVAPKNHFELLRVLARARRTDAEKGLPDPNCGWLSVEELSRKVNADLGYVNVQIYRNRSQFAAFGLIDPARIVERRGRTRLVRFGSPQSFEEACEEGPG